MTAAVHLLLACVIAGRGRVSFDAVAGDAPADGSLARNVAEGP